MTSAAEVAAVFRPGEVLTTTEVQRRLGRKATEVLLRAYGTGLLERRLQPHGFVYEWWLPGTDPPPPVKVPEVPAPQRRWTPGSAPLPDVLAALRKATADGPATAAQVAARMGIDTSLAGAQLGVLFAKRQVERERAERPNAAGYMAETFVWWPTESPTAAT